MAAKEAVPVFSALAENVGIKERISALHQQVEEEMREEGASEQEVREVAQVVDTLAEGIQETETALARAEARAAKKVSQRQATLSKDSKGDLNPAETGSGGLGVDLGNPYDNLSSPIYEDIAHDLRAEKLQILQNCLQALERQQSSSKREAGWASNAFTFVKKAVTEQIAAVRADPWGAVRGAAEFIPGPTGTAAYAGNSTYDIAVGTKTVGEVAFEASVAYAAGKAGVLAYRGVKAVSKAAYKKGASSVETFFKSRKCVSRPLRAEDLGLHPVDLGLGYTLDTLKGTFKFYPHSKIARVRVDNIAGDKLNMFSIIDHLKKVAADQGANVLQIQGHKIVNPDLASVLSRRYKMKTTGSGIITYEAGGYDTYIHGILTIPLK